VFFQLDRCVEAFSTHVADVWFGSVWVMAELVMLIKQLLIPGGVVAQFTFVNVWVVAVVFLV